MISVWTLIGSLRNALLPLKGGYSVSERMSQWIVWKQLSGQLSQVFQCYAGKRRAMLLSHRHSILPWSQVFLLLQCNSLYSLANCCCSWISALQRIVYMWCAQHPGWKTVLHISALICSDLVAGIPAVLPWNSCVFNTRDSNNMIKASKTCQFWFWQ